MVFGNRLWNPGFVDDQLRHLLRVAGKDDDHRITAVLDVLDDGVDRFPAEVLLAASGQRVRLVDEQHAAVGRVEDLGDLGRGLADEAGDQPASIDLDELPLLDDSEGAVDPGQQSAHGGLAGSGVAAEDQVLRVVDDREVPLLAEPLDPQQGGQEFHLLLHRIEADQTVELGQQVHQWLRRLQRFGRFGGPCIGRPLASLPAAGGAVDGRHFWPTARQGRHQQPLELHDRPQLVVRRVVVDRGDGVGQRHRLVVVDPGQA